MTFMKQLVLLLVSTTLFLLAMNSPVFAQMGGMISMIAHQWTKPLGAIASKTNDLK